MSAMASQITSLTIVYSTVYTGADQRKHQSSASLAFVRGIHRWPVNSPHKGPVNEENVSIWRRLHAENTSLMRSWRVMTWRPSCNMSLPEPMFTQIYVAIWRHYRPQRVNKLNALKSSELVIKHNGISPVWRQAIAWYHADLLSVGTTSVKFKIRIKIRNISFQLNQFLRLMLEVWRYFEIFTHAQLCSALFRLWV